MSFPKYDRYKNSGVERLGEVPEHWEIGSLKRGFQIVGGSTPKSEQESYWDGAIVWVTPADLSKLSTMYISDSSRKITSAGLLSCGTTMVPAGSIVISTRAPIGSLAISERELCTNQGCKSLVALGNRCYSSYYGYLLSVSTIALNIRGKGTTFLELSSDELGAFNIPYPPLPEQRSIAAFLDRETTKIDELIAEQRQLIDLLKEKRQAVISHAVTKGLNPDAPMKDSAIEWLGEVPEHWDITRIKWYFDTASGGTPDTSKQDLYYAEEEGIPWIRTTDLGNDVLSSFEVSITEKALCDTACAVLPVETVMVAMYGGDGTIGKNGILAIPATINQAVCGLLPNSSFVSTFTFRYIQFYRPHWMIGAESSRKDPNISQALIRNAPILRPPLEEQNQIVTFIERETTKLDELIAEAQHAIALLQERRTALISAAVTGKIDVRSLV